MRRGGIGWAAAGLAMAAPAGAQNAASPTTASTGDPQPTAKPGAVDGRTTYDFAYFQRYAPSTAFQIVQRVPGFTLEDTDQNVRGFGQAAGNVVVSGQRPSVKTDTLQTILDRIPAARVLRVEVGPGELFGAEYASKPQVLNLVLSAAGGLAGTMDANVRRDFTGRVLPGGAVSAIVKRGRSSFNVAGTMVNQATAVEGHDRLTALPGGAQLEYRDKLNRLKEPTATVTAGWDYDGGANRTAHLNLRYSADRFVLDQTNHVVPTGRPERDDTLAERYVRNLTDASVSRERLFFDPDRRTRDPGAREFRHRNQHVVPVVSIKRNFG